MPSILSSISNEVSGDRRVKVPHRNGFGTKKVFFILMKMAKKMDGVMADYL